MTREAVILAAGQGLRLGRYADNKPKGCLQLGDLSIIEESVEKLISIGVETIWIVTGFQSQYFDQLVDRFPDHLRTVRNKSYKISGSMYSLAQMSELISPPFLLLESDIIYEYRALEQIVKYSEENCVLLSGFTGSGDEVFVETIGKQLVFMSKDRTLLGNEPTGELVGISKISRSLFTAMLDFSTREFKKSLLIDYETDALVSCAKNKNIDCLLIPDLVWAEIDDYTHLQRAKEIIYPEIQRRES